MPRCIWCLPALLLSAAVLIAADNDHQPKPFDWPQWQGPERTAFSKETGLLKEWPKDGPAVVWKAKGLGGGYSAPSVAAGRVFGMSYRGKEEGVWALDDTAEGKELWWTPINDKALSLPNGPEGSRCTPTVDGDLLYALGTSGDLVCLNVKDGKEVWRKNLTKDFGGKVPRWGYSESPLVDGDKLICTPGGKDATLAALNKKTGETIWKSTIGDEAAYASCIAVNFAGAREYIQFLKGGVVGVDAANGKLLWRYNKPANGVANCSTPIFHDGEVFAASAYNTGGGLVKLSKDDKTGVKAEEVFFTKEMNNHHGGVILLDGFLYGANGGNGGGYLVCLDAKTGKVMWDEKSKPRGEGVTKGSVAFADGRMYYRQENGVMLLVEPGSKEYVEKGRFTPPDCTKRDVWPHPVIANGKLYLRDQGVLLCYDIKDKK